MATISLIPDTSPQDQATSDLVNHLRDDVIPGATAGAGLQAYVGGTTATFLDFSAKVASRLPVFIALVVGLSVLLLMAAFRSSGSRWCRRCSTCCRSSRRTDW